MKIRDLLKRLKADGWISRGLVGSHEQFVHPIRPGKVTVATGHGLNEEIKPGTLRSIERQAGWRP
jgi:predicted RNA binding protein YcfA (HicA-like mRNA interferase family)